MLKPTQQTSDNFLDRYRNILAQMQETNQAFIKQLGEKHWFYVAGSAQAAEEGLRTLEKLLEGLKIDG